MSDADASRSRPGSFWFCLVRGAAGRPGRAVVVDSVRYPDGTRIELSEDMARAQIGDRGLCVLDLDADGAPTQAVVADWFAPGAPPVWFLEVRESTASPPAVNLVAFCGGGPVPGTIVAGADASNYDLGGDQPGSGTQVGAVRWYPATGEVDQIYVQPAWRRRRLASVLLAAAGTISVARGWANFWGDGQRTMDGEGLRNAASWAHRAADLTHLAPSMTPPPA